MSSHISVTAAGTLSTAPATSTAPTTPCNNMFGLMKDVEPSATAISANPASPATSTQSAQYATSATSATTQCQQAGIVADLLAGKVQWIAQEPRVSADTKMIHISIVRAGSSVPLFADLETNLDVSLLKLGQQICADATAQKLLKPLTYPSVWFCQFVRDKNNLALYEMAKNANDVLVYREATLRYYGFRDRDTIRVVFIPCRVS
ncbi:hypothetical protein OAM67_00285 [bacterium]|nr:hypothetical protein [bacterium]